MKFLKEKRLNRICCLLTRPHQIRNGIEVIDRFVGDYLYTILVSHVS